MRDDILKRHECKLHIDRIIIGRNNYCYGYALQFCFILKYIGQNCSAPRELESFNSDWVKNKRTLPQFGYNPVLHMR